MPNHTTPKITRRGFAKAPAAMRLRAQAIIDRHVAGTAPVLAELRPATYCGPGSGGDRGAYMLSLHVGGQFSLHTIEAPAEPEPVVKGWDGLPRRGDKRGPIVLGTEAK